MGKTTWKIPDFWDVMIAVISIILCFTFVIALAVISLGT